MASNMLRQRVPAVSEAIASPTAPATVVAVWRHALAALGLVIAWILVCYASTAMGIVDIWSRSETFAHGFVVVPIVIWLVWRRRAHVVEIAPRPAPWVIALIAVAGIAWTFGRLSEVNVLAQFSMAAMIVLAVPALLGIPVARRLVFPLAFLFFAVPMGEFILPVLMDWTADFTIAALRASGIPVYREGLMFVIPTGAWSVIEACSGIRYLIASLMVGTLYAYLSYRSNRRRWLFVGFAIVVPIVANWVRAYLIVLLGHLSGNRLAVGVDHLIYGWLFFGIVITLMFWIGGRWREDEAPGATVGGEAGTSAAASASRDAAVAARPSLFWLVALCAMLVIALFPAAQSRVDAAGGDAGPVQLAQVTPATGWNFVPRGLASWEPVFQQPSATFEGSFVRGNQAVGLYIAYYRDQDASRKLVSSSNVLVRSTDNVWRRVASGSTGEIMVGDLPVTMTTAELVHGSVEKLVAWKFYWVDGRLTASDYLAKLYTAMGRLRNGRDDAAVVVVYVRADNAKSAAPLLQSFVREQGGAIIAALAATREHR